MAICGYEAVPFDFLPQLVNLYRDGPLPLVTARGLYIQANRNNCVKRALEVTGWDYMLSLDTDMVLPNCLLERVRSYTDPVVGGLYFRRQWPDYGPIPGNMDQTEVPQFTRLTDEQLDPMLADPGLYPCDVLGTGCMAIRRDVIENWPQDMMPRFATMTSQDGVDIVTEDVYFCWRLKQQGIQPMLDTQVRCGHVGPFTFGTKTYLQGIRNAS